MTIFCFRSQIGGTTLRSVLYCAAVIGPERVAVAGLRDNGQMWNGAPESWGDPVKILARAAELFDRNDGGTLLLDLDAWPDSAHAELRADGWIFTELDTWTTFRRAGVGQLIHVGLLPRIDARKTVLFSPNDVDWRRTASRLANYQAITGVPYRATAGVSAIAMMRNQYRSPLPGRQPKWYPGEDSPHGRNGVRLHAAGDLSWTRELNEQELRWLAEQRSGGGADRPLVVKFDINAQYLAAASRLPLAWGDLVNTGRIPFDDRLSGYWQIRYADIDWPAQLPPVVAKRRVDDDGLIWVTTPVLELLAEHGCTPEILDSWTGEGPAILRAWADRLASARVGMLGVPTLDDRVMKAVKSTYAEGIGMLQRPRGLIFRRDWGHMVIDKARCNLLRKLIAVWRATAERPIKIYRDAVWYVDGPAVAELLRREYVHPLQLGKFKEVPETGEGPASIATRLTLAAWVDANTKKGKADK